MKLLQKAAVGCAYGEPWRANGGVLVTDQPGVSGLTRGAGDRAYYGGALIAESMGRTLAARAADCVNFCAGVEFKPGHAYVGGLLDVLDMLETLHKRMPEPEIPTLTDRDREYYELYRTVDEVLRQFGRDSFARLREQNARSACA